MEIKILGTRGEIESSAPYHTKHSGILIDKKFLFDLGEEEFLDYEPKYIFITHLHPDHAYFVRDENDITKFEKSLYLPEKYKNYSHKILSKTKKIDSYEITPIPTLHSLKVKSQAYLIKKANEKILYTGDMIWIDKKYHKLLENLNLVITEGSFIREKGLIKKHTETGKIYGHTGIPDLMKLFRQFTHRILFIHFGSWFYKDIKIARNRIRALARENNITAHIGYDGMNIDTKNLK